MYTLLDGVFLLVSRVSQFNYVYIFYREREGREWEWVSGSSCRERCFIGYLRVTPLRRGGTEIIIRKKALSMFMKGWKTHNKKCFNFFLYLYN